MLKLLWKVTKDEYESETNIWRPFEGKYTTEILKATTYDIADVPMTIMDLRTAAESYADLVGQEDMQSALGVAEGHTERVAMQYYRRNGSSTMMRPWVDHIEKLIHGQDDSGDNGGVDSAMDEKIEKTMELSQQEWVRKVEKEIRDLTIADQKKRKELADQMKRKALADQKGQPTMKRKVWSEEDDTELRKLVRIHGVGNWMDMLEDSSMLKERYDTAPTGKFKDSVPIINIFASQFFSHNIFS